jgi:gliding motility-associated-like protein
VTPTANGCSGATESFDITIDPSPIVNAVADQTLCNNTNTTAVIFGSSTPGTTYSWTNSDPSIGLAATGNGDISSFTATNATGTSNSATITVTPSANGCVGSSTSFLIIVDPSPTVDPIADVEVCANENVNTITFTSPNAGTTFDWTNDNTSVGLGGAGAGNINTFVGNNAGVAPVTGNVVVTPTANGCVGATENFSITINPLPAVFAGNDIAVCAGEQVVLTGSGAMAGGYVWDNGVTDGVAFSPLGGVYTVVGTDANGCVNSDDVLVTIEALPIPSFIVDVPPCEPFTVTLTNTTPGPVDNCVWSINDGSNPINGCGPIVYTFSEAGTFDVTLTTSSALGCEASVTYTDIIYLENSPNASFDASNYNVTNLNTEVIFNNSSTNASSYVWSFGDESANSSAVNPIHVFPSEESGVYTVTLIATSSMGCVDTAYATITVSEEVIFYVPNTFTPDDDDYNETFKPVFTSGFNPFDFTMLIFNRWGEIIFESHDASVGWDATYSGRYPVQDGTYTWKIIFKTLATDERREVIGHVNVLR